MPHPKKPDYVIVELSLADTKILVACVYRPPKAGYFDEFTEDFVSLSTDYKYHVVFGDVNAHFGSSKPCDIRDGKSVLEFLDLLSLVRVPYSDTYHVHDYHSNLDMIASSLSERLVYFNQCASGLSNHDLLTAVFSLDVPRFTPRLSTFRSFRNFNLEHFKKDIVDIPWHDMFHLQDINSKLDYFYQQVYALFDKHAPYISVKVKHKPSPWLTDELKRMIKERDKMYEKVKYSKDHILIAQFKKLKNRTKSEIRNAKVRYAYGILNNCNSSQTLWKNLKKLGVSNENNGETCKFPSSEELNAHYTAVKCQDEDLLKASIKMYENKFLNWEAQANTVRKNALAAIHGLKKHCDILPINVRKKLVETLVFPVLEYGSVVTSQMLVTCSIKLQRVQNACARLIFDLRSDCSISNYLTQLKWLNYKNRCVFASVTLLKKVICNNCPVYLADKLQFACDVRNRSVRGSHLLLRVPLHRTDMGRGAFWITGPLLWNSVPAHILTKKLYSFKSQLKNHLLASQF
ncbi:hypothetical protein ONE63_000004 [Megalurothrips usitatus]|uniref:Endonuclease/exonuclease/phosphatase domain-containing protein n=1 Tax=Megalurothrips usitatus TaxID=439358 RepID=A0AAV7Y166_9NEOP|nr:hypothetical protein ONE63_000004 [Megalurothrips usitatus]